MNMFNAQTVADSMNQGFSGFSQNQGPVEIDLTDDSKEKDRRDRRRKRCGNGYHIIRYLLLNQMLFSLN